MSNAIKERIDTGHFAFGQILVVLICFTLNMLDGFDIIAMSVVAPILSNEWGTSSRDTGYILSAALFGMTMGALFLAPLCDKYGRRFMILAASIATGLCMLLTTQVPQSVLWLVVIRVLTGLGIGVIMASTTAITSEFVPERWRNLCVPLVVLGYPFGAMLVGPVEQMLIPSYGWEALFYFGGGCTLLLATLMFFLLPESIAYLASQRGNDTRRLSHINNILSRLSRAPLKSLPPPPSVIKAAHVTTLLRPEFRATSIKLWIISFSSLLNMYLLLAYLPSLFVDSGLSRAAGSTALTFFNLGGVLGIVAIGVLSSRMHLLKPITWFFAISALLMFVYAWLESSNTALLNALIFLVGLCFQGGYTGASYTVSSRAYPPVIRATGVGWAIGLGRTGAIVSPVLVGYLISFGWDMYSLFALFALPIVLVTFLVPRLKLVDY